MKADDLKKGKRYKTQGDHTVIFVDIADGYENFRVDGHTLVSCLMHGRLYLFSSRDLIEEM